jgi:xanthine dehydrogenase accessory factor
VITVPISCQSEGALQIYIEPCQISPTLVVVGRSPMAYTLVEMARLLDWNVDLVDGSDFSASSLTNNSIVVVATQGHGDEDVLATAIAADALYIGVVASARRGDALKGYLRDVGHETERVEALQIPVGLDLGHTTHREVAVAVLAELVQRRARGEFAPRTLVVPPRAEYVIDPVCGMTVAAEESNRPFEHEGQTYYFCCPGCRYVFKEDPAKYLTEEEASC